VSAAGIMLNDEYDEENTNHASNLISSIFVITLSISILFF
jgi:hypothetical protein